jgi:DNA processing protein
MITSTPFQKFGFNFLEIETQDEGGKLLNDLPEKGFAVIGTRYPQKKSLDFMQKTFSQLKNSNLVIVSGFAKGIDTWAHELAIENGLKTIAILGCGLNIDYPRENWALRKKILDHGGMIISPFESNQHPTPRSFLWRNELIPYFSKAVWVVEAAAISGTLNTAKHTSAQNRDLYATPCFPNDPMFEGNQKLLSQKQTEKYAVADSFYGAESLCKTWGSLQFKNDQKKKIDRKNLTRIQKWILDLKFDYGVCRVQNLMNHARTQGLTLGEFYFEYQKEVDEGKINEDLLGTVELG